MSDWGARYFLFISYFSSYLTFTHNFSISLSLAFKEIVQFKPRVSSSTFQLSTCVSPPKYVGQMKGELSDAWIHSITAYFKKSPAMPEATRLHIVGLQL